MEFCRCAVGIGGRRAVSDAPCLDLRGASLCGVCLVSLCHGDWWGACSVGCVWHVMSLHVILLSYVVGTSC